MSDTRCEKDDFEPFRVAEDLLKKLPALQVLVEDGPLSLFAGLAFFREYGFGGDEDADAVIENGRPKEAANVLARLEVERAI